MKPKVPEITEKFIRKIKADAVRGEYQVRLNGIQIDVSPFVFPPTSRFSNSSKLALNYFPVPLGARVLDVGTGTGVLAIQAAKAGAGYVEALDISKEAVDCARRNVILNKVGNRVIVYQSDMFENVLPYANYDLIVSNPPIIDAPADQKDKVLISLFDPEFKFHRKLFHEASQRLAQNGVLRVGHANLQANGFNRLERLARENNFGQRIINSEEALGYEWRTYEFFRK